MDQRIVELKTLQLKVEDNGALTIINGKDEWEHKVVNTTDVPFVDVFVKKPIVGEVLVSVVITCASLEVGEPVLIQVLFEGGVEIPYFKEVNVDYKNDEQPPIFPGMNEFLAEMFDY